MLGLHLEDNTQNASLDISIILQQTTPLPTTKPLFDVVNKQATLLKGCSISWIVSFYLSRYSKKHIFTGRRKPSIAVIGKALREWSHRLRWMYSLRNSNSNPFYRYQSKKAIKPYDGVVDSELERYIQQMTDAVYDKCLASKSRQTTRTSNIPNIVRYAWFLLQKSSEG